MMKPRNVTGAATSVSPIRPSKLALGILSLAALLATPVLAQQAEPKDGNPKPDQPLTLAAPGTNQPPANPGSHADVPNAYPLEFNRRPTASNAPAKPKSADAPKASAKTIPSQQERLKLAASLETADGTLPSAFAFYEQAARYGSPVGQRKAGEFLLSGRGVRPDAPRALYWFTRAASQGDPPAQLALARIYSDTSQPNADLKQAYLWAGLVVAIGNRSPTQQSMVADASALLQNLTPRIDPNAVQQANAWVLRFRPRIEEDLSPSPSDGFNALASKAQRLNEELCEKRPAIGAYVTYCFVRTNLEFCARKGEPFTLDQQILLACDVFFPARTQVSRLGPGSLAAIGDEFLPTIGSANNQELSPPQVAAIGYMIITRSITITRAGEEFQRCKNLLLDALHSSNPTPENQLLHTGLSSNTLAQAQIDLPFCGQQQPVPKPATPPPPQLGGGVQPVNPQPTPPQRTRPARRPARPFQ
jgi:TPR repeat protein